MAILILGGLQAITYFWLKPTSLTGLELFFLIWGAVNIVIWLSNLFGVRPIPMNQLTLMPVVLKNSDKPHNRFAIKLLGNLQYFILVLINVILYIVIISPHY